MYNKTLFPTFAPVNKTETKNCKKMKYARMRKAALAVAALLLLPLAPAAAADTAADGRAWQPSPLGVAALLPDTAVAADTAACCPLTAACAAGNEEVPDLTHRIRPAEWIVPGAAAVLGAVCVKSSWGTKARRSLQHTLSAHGKQKTSVDDYIQYAPTVVAYALPLCGVKSTHGLKDRTLLLAMSYAMMGIAVNVSKRAFKEKRPDSGARNSFPSGHTATAFMGAEYLWQEYRHTHPIIGYGGYVVATAVGFMRIHNDRHWANDVLAGAAVGMLSTKFAYWLYPKIFRESPRRSKNSTAFMGMPYASTDGAGLSMALVF